MRLTKYEHVSPRLLLMFYAAALFACVLLGEALWRFLGNEIIHDGAWYGANILFVCGVFLLGTVGVREFLEFVERLPKVLLYFVALLCLRGYALSSFGPPTPFEIAACLLIAVSVVDESLRWLMSMLEGLRYKVARDLERQARELSSAGSGDAGARRSDEG